MMKQVFLSITVFMFLCNPANLNAALWEYSANGEIHNQDTNQRYTITGNFFIDGTLRCQNGDPVSEPGYDGGWDYFYNIPQYTIYLAEQGSSDLYHSATGHGGFHWQIGSPSPPYTIGFSNWFLNNNSGELLWYGFDADFFHANGDRYRYAEEALMLAPMIVLGNIAHQMGGIYWPDTSWEYANVASTINLTRIKSVPEPSTWMLFGIAIISVLVRRRRFL